MRYAQHTVFKPFFFSEGDVSKGGYEDIIWGNVREKFASMGLLPLEFTDCLQDSPYFRYSVFEKYLHCIGQFSPILFPR